MYGDLLTALAGTGIPLAEYAWETRPDTDYLVVQLDGQGASLESDNMTGEQAVEGSVDLFCYGKNRANYDAVWGVLRTSGCSVRLNSVQYENETRLIHYEWVFQLPYLEAQPAAPATTEGGGANG